MTAKDVALKCIEVIHSAGMSGCVVINQDEDGQYETTLGSHSPFQKTKEGTLRFQQRTNTSDELVTLLENDVHNLRALEHGLDVARDHVHQMRQTIEETFSEQDDEEYAVENKPKKDKKYDVN